MCWNLLSRCLTRNQGNIRKARIIRDENLNCFENTNLFFGALLAIFGIAHLICGAKFINSDLAQNGHGMIRLTRYLSLFIGFSCTITLVHAMWTYCVVKRPGCYPWYCLPIYALLPFLAMPVLFSEGAVLYELSRLDAEDILKMCDLK